MDDNAHIAQYTQDFWHLYCEYILAHQKSTSTLIHSNIQPLPGDAARKQGRAIADRTASQLLKEGKATLVDAYGEKDEKFKRRDLSSLMLKVNIFLRARG